jgi:hypothetical protein
MQYVGLSGFTRGNAAAETGINLNSISCRFYPQFKDKLNDYTGAVRGFAIPDKLTREVSVQGEVSGATGIMAAKFVTAVTLGNTAILALFEAVNAGGNAGGFYVDEVTPGSTRDGWLAISMRLTADPGVA